MAEHTLPWRVDSRSANHIVSDKRPICSIGFFDSSNPDGSQAENVAIAALIVTAVNCHDDLVAALEDLIRALDKGVSRETMLSCEGTAPKHSVLGIARTALAKAAKAKGGS